MQKPFILKFNGEPRLVDLRAVRFPPVTRLKETVEIPGFGNVPVRENTGKYDKSQVTLFTTSANITVEVSKDAVHARIRRLRQQEADELDKIDAQIAELRERRADLVGYAWSKANVVTVKELIEQAESKNSA